MLGGLQCLLTGSGLVLLLLAVTGRAQIPSFGGCAEYQPMVGFERNNFMGTWYEQERYFTLSELAGKCISATYERRIDGKVYVNNTVVNRFTNVQRIVTGEIQDNPSKRTPGQFNVRYTGLPIAYESTMNVLDTDYKTYAVLWSCNRLGPIGHTDTFWVMTRKRLESGPGLQRAYGVLDKFKVSRTFFIKTEQNGCETLPDQEEALDPTPIPVASTYGPPMAAETTADAGLDAVLLDGVDGNGTDNKGSIDNTLAADDSLITVGGEQEVLIELAENYVPITNSIGYRGKDAAGEQLQRVEGEGEKKRAEEVATRAVPAKSIVEVLKKAAVAAAEV